MPRDTDCGCCEAQKAFVVCFECGKGDKTKVPLCKDCSSFIHRGLLSGHQVSSISRLNALKDRDYKDITPVPSEPTFYDTNTVGSSFSKRSDNTYKDDGESLKYDLRETTNGYQKDNFDPPPDFVDDRTEVQTELDYNDLASASGYMSERGNDDMNDKTSNLDYSSNQLLVSFPCPERGHSLGQLALPKVRYMDDEVFKVIVNSSLHPEGSFWAALVRSREEEEDFERFEDDLAYSASTASLCEHLDPGTEVLAKVKYKWYRAKVEYSLSASGYKVRQTDYGRSARVHLDQMRNLPLKFYTIPYQVRYFYPTVSARIFRRKPMLMT